MVFLRTFIHWSFWPLIILAVISLTSIKHYDCKNKTEAYNSLDTIKYGALDKPVQKRSMRIHLPLKLGENVSVYKALTATIIMVTISIMIAQCIRGLKHSVHPNKSRRLSYDLCNPGFEGDNEGNHTGDENTLLPIEEYGEEKAIEHVEEIRIQTKKSTYTNVAVCVAALLGALVITTLILSVILSPRDTERLAEISENPLRNQFQYKDTTEPMTLMTEKPMTEKPMTEKPMTETPMTETPMTEKPMTEKPMTETPMTEKPMTETPMTEKPMTETPMTETPMTEKPPMAEKQLLNIKTLDKKPNALLAKKLRNSKKQLRLFQMGLYKGN